MLVKKVKEVKDFEKLSLYLSFAHGTLKNDVKASNSPNPSLTSLIVRQFKVNGVRTPNYILTFSEVLNCVSSLVKSFFTSFFTNSVMTPFSMITKLHSVYLTIFFSCCNAIYSKKKTGNQPNFSYITFGKGGEGKTHSLKWRVIRVDGLANEVFRLSVATSVPTNAEKLIATTSASPVAYSFDSIDSVN